MSSYSIILVCGIPNNSAAYWQIIFQIYLFEGNCKNPHDLEGMLSHKELAELYRLTQSFVQMVTEQRSEQLDEWLTQAKHCQFSAFRRLARGLEQDYVEVKAALMLPWSNGQVEGNVNRLKLVKRQMYGRAKFDLLRQRVLQPI